MSAEQERWAAVPGYEGLYEVSDMGRLRRLTYRGRTAEHVYETPRILKPRQHGKTGYLRVSLYRDDKGKSMSLHRVVLMAFVGPAEPGMEAAHNNGIRADCRLSNLRWATPEENRLDKIKHGTVNQGERAGSAMLTEAKVREIRGLLASGKRQYEVAKQYGVHPGSISKIGRGATWKHVKN